jgi:hypothetical protein
VGYSVPHGTQDSGVEQPKVNKETAKYVGLYIAQGGYDGYAKLYLYEDSTCSRSEENLPKEHFQSCTWFVEGKKLTVREVKYMFCDIMKTCEDYASGLDSTSDLIGEPHITELKEGDLNYGNHKYAVYWDLDTKYDILDDGSLSEHNNTYVKRSSL